MQSPILTRKKYLNFEVFLLHFYDFYSKDIILESFSLFGIFVVGFIGAITPGPDILLVLRYGLTFGLKHSVCAFLGIASGWIVFLGVIYLGFGIFLNTIVFQCILSLVGGLYLWYLSVCMVRFKVDEKAIQSQINTTDSPPQNFLASYIKGLVINLSNPKAILFFTTIIVPFMGVDIGKPLLVLFLSLATPFCLVIVVANFAHKFVTPRVFVWIDRICAVVFGVFGVFLLYNGIVLAKDMF